MITKKKLRKVINEMMNEIVDKIKNDDTIADGAIAGDCPSLMFYCGVFAGLFNLSVQLNLYSQKEREMILEALKGFQQEEPKKEES